MAINERYGTVSELQTVSASPEYPAKHGGIMTRILLYSDEPILAKGLESVLRQVEGFELLPACSTVAGVVDQVAHGGPDLVLMDLTHEITFAVLSELKHSMLTTKIVLWVNTIS